MKNYTNSDDFLAQWTSGLEVPARRSREEAWNQLVARIEAGQQPAGRVVRFRPQPVWAALAAAAAVALLLGGYWLFSPRTLEISAPPAAHLAHTLPDGSVVKLNAESSISYDRNGWSGDRSIRLEGEAWFDVEPGARFEVRTVYGTVTVLGTEFNVRAREGAFEVACFSGKVQVQPASGRQAAVLSPGEAVRTAADGALSAFEAEGAAPGWQSGTFTFREAPFAEVVAELERQFDVQIVEMPDMTGRTYTGAFFSDNLTDALQMVCEPMGLSAIFEGDKQIRLESRR
ncbi:MAG: FecR domain-containing protein [Bacteroidia bacterium]|nr:FecR domain-containing protein [Bacteroidia bacterium]